MLKVGSHICLKDIGSRCLVFRQTYYNDAGILMYMSKLSNNMCGYICVDVNRNRGGPAKASAKSTELYTMKAGPPIVKLFNIWHFMNKVALFHSQLCIGLDVWHKRFYVNQRT